MLRRMSDHDFSRSSISSINDARPVAIVVPTEWEFAPYRELLPGLRPLDGVGPWEAFEALAGEQTVVLIVSGAGPVNAGAATERLIAGFRPLAVLHGGSAGAHNPDLMPGDFVLGARYIIAAPDTVRQARVARGLHPSLIRFRRHGVEVHMAEIAAHPELLQHAESLAQQQAAALGVWNAPGWPEDLPRRAGSVVSGAIASADAWTVEPVELRRLHDEFGAECEDMESAYVAQVCAMHELPFLAVRVISNNDLVSPLATEAVQPALAAAGHRAALVLIALAAGIPAASAKA